MKREIIYVIIVAATVAACDPSRIDPDRPVIEDTKNKVELVSDTVEFCTPEPPAFAVRSSLDGHSMKAIIRGIDIEPDTLTFESSASEAFGLPLLSEGMWESMRSQFCSNAVTARLEGKIIDLTDNDTTEFTREVRFLPLLTSVVDHQRGSVSLTTEPRNLQSAFSLVTREDPETIKSITRYSADEYGYSLAEPGEQFLEFTWNKFPSYRYRVAVRRVIKNYVYMSLREVEETIEGKAFSRVYPVIRFAPMMSDKYTTHDEDLTIKLKVTAKGSCEWHNDGNWGDPESKEKLKNGYHFPMNACDEFVDSMTVSGVSSAYKAQPTIIPMDMTKLIFNYHPDVYLESTYLDPVSGELCPIYTIPIPQHYYRREAFRIDIHYSCPGDPEMKYVELSEFLLYDTSFSAFIKQYAEARKAEGVLDEQGLSALLSWGESVPESHFHRIIPEDPED